MKFFSKSIIVISLALALCAPTTFAQAPTAAQYQAATSGQSYHELSANTIRGMNNGRYWHKNSKNQQEIIPDVRLERKNYDAEKEYQSAMNQFFKDAPKTSAVTNN